ncbi:hypothetical protein LN042_23990 [Kitasatospora sp. RB6PN24]|uniref:hypothetical protein n=1 Tax=Kitasatospora humi TaxID=2893891 RepID=UPI001E318B0F|nr:hypothetical protein [Kitasatospora humi]MCC9310091.1 hypothetical protein [Kitasatospora humi]
MTTDSPYVTLPLKAATDPNEIARTVLTLAECRSAIDIEIAGQTIRYYTNDHEVAAVLAPAALREAYPDTPSIGRLMLDSTLQYHQWQQARLAGQRAPGSVPADFVRQLHRTYLLLRSAALDLVAIQSPFDLHSTAQCTQETNRALPVSCWRRASTSALDIPTEYRRRPQDGQLRNDPTAASPRPAGRSGSTAGPGPRPPEAPSPLRLMIQRFHPERPTLPGC